MPLRPVLKKCLAWITLLICMSVPIAFADSETTIDRIQLVTQQANLLKIRLAQSQQELAELQHQHEQEFSQDALEKASKHLVDKAMLDITVAKTNLESINVEFADAQQTISWLGKSIQEIQTQINLFNIFGPKVIHNELSNTKALNAELNYEQKLLQLEQARLQLLENLQLVGANILEIKKDNYTHLSTLLKSQKMLLVRQQQVKDELSYQQQQNFWLQELNVLNTRLTKTDPVKAKEEYANLERAIFYANENANYAYIQSLLARYRDQIQQMKLSLVRINSISLLNEMRDQMQILNKQISHLDNTLKSKIESLDKHISYLTPKIKKSEQIQSYLKKLQTLKSQYQEADLALLKINDNNLKFRTKLDNALQHELAARQGFPIFTLKAMLNLGKEFLLVPTLTFEVVKSLSSKFIKAFQVTSALGWTLFGIAEGLLLIGGLLLNRFLSWLLNRPSKWRDQINSKWLSLQWLQRNLFDLMVIANIFGILIFFKIPVNNYGFIVYLSLVWLIVKGILTISRLCLLETTHHSGGHDVKLYRRLKWTTLLGGLIIFFTVFVHQLPLIYDFKMMCDQIFLFFLMLVSILLLRSWEVVPNLILSHMENRPRYFHHAVRLIGILIPLLMFSNSVIGLIGYMNLVMTMAWYEGIFVMVLIGYIILRGLLTDSLEQLSSLMIRYVNNGWLWTEAFLKPLNKVLRIALFFTAWGVLFLLYGWDKQSPIVERLIGLLHYRLVSIASTPITFLSIVELVVLISVFYWTAKWTREFVYRSLSSRTIDMGIRNTIAILSQYTVIIFAVFITLSVLGINLRAIEFVASMLAFGIGFGLRDLANNFVSGFLILLERPLRVGDIVSVHEIEGEVIHIGSRAVTIRTSDHMELVVPNSEIFNKSFTNWTAHDNIVRSVIRVKISRFDNPHTVRMIIQNVLAQHKEVLKDPAPDVYLKEMNDTLMDFELRYYVNIRQVKARTQVISSVLMKIWDQFAAHGIKPPNPQHEVFLRRGDLPVLTINEEIKPS